MRVLNLLYLKSVGCFRSLLVICIYNNARLTEMYLFRLTSQVVLYKHRSVDVTAAQGRKQNMAVPVLSLIIYIKVEFPDKKGELHES